MKVIRYALIALLLGALVACDTAGGLPNPPGGDGPDLEFLIRNVEIAPSTITLGESAFITWEASDSGVTVDVSPKHGQSEEGSPVAVTPTEAGEIKYELTARLSGYKPEVHVVALTVLTPNDSSPETALANIKGQVLTLDGALMHDETDLLAPLEDFPTDASSKDPLRQNMYGVFRGGVASSWLLPHDGETVTVAYIGRGVRTEHKEFGSALLQGYDFCANWDCTETDDDIDTINDGEEAASFSAVGTTEIGALAAASNNGQGGMNFAGPHEGVIKILPLKTWHQKLNPAGDAIDLNSHPDAFLNALAYALGEDPRTEGLAAREAVDIVYFDYTFHDEELKLGLPTQQTRLRELLGKAVDKQVLIIMPDYYFEDEVAELSNPLGRIAREEYRDIFLGVYTESCPPNIPCQPGPEADVVTQASVPGPSDLHFSDDWGYYAPSSPITTAVGIAALLQHHKGLRGSALRDAMRNDAACTTAACPELPSPRLDLALGLPGPGDTILLELKGQNGELIQQQELTLNYSGIANYEFEFELDAAGTYIVEATAQGATYTIYDSREQEIWAGGQTVDLLLKPKQPGE